jgi:hypothetical protein
MFLSYLITVPLALHLTGHWEQKSLNLTTINQQNLVHHAKNMGPTPITVQGNQGSDQRLQRVIGAGDTTPNPNWSAAFTPLSYSQVSVEWSFDTHTLTNRFVGLTGSTRRDIKFSSGTIMDQRALSSAAIVIGLNHKGISS